MATQQWKYHVFISFRGEETRNNFVRHLYGALSRKGLKTFVDNQLPRGEEISSALFQAIQDSKVAVVIFSQNYASSSWCLDELLKIIECHETYNQIVIPVFYHVDPSDVQKQNASFKKSFQMHSCNPWNNKKIQKWKDALTKAANLRGHSSFFSREDNALIDAIVRDSLQKLNFVQWKYHVVISFRGGDTRCNFVCHLYDALSRKGLETFVHNQPRGGEEILLQAIDDSKVAVVIFSENYASSSWCLDELLKITERHETHNQIIIPVFYHVDPSDVRKQNGSFKKSFDMHSCNPGNNKKIQKWKDALTKAANISGRASYAIREDTALIDQIVRDVEETVFVV